MSSCPPPQAVGFTETLGRDLRNSALLWQSATDFMRTRSLSEGGRICCLGFGVSQERRSGIRTVARRARRTRPAGTIVSEDVIMLGEGYRNRRPDASRLLKRQRPLPFREAGVGWWSIIVDGITAAGGCPPSNLH